MSNTKQKTGGIEGSIHAALVKGLLEAGDDTVKIKLVAEQALESVAQLEAGLVSAADLNKELQDKLAAFASGVKIKPSFTYKKEVYEANHAVNLDGVKYTPEQIAENAAVQKQLVEGDSDAVSKKAQVTE